MHSIGRMPTWYMVILLLTFWFMFVLGWVWTTHLVPTDSDLQQWADVSECINEAADRAGTLTAAEVEIVWATCQGRR